MGKQWLKRSEVTWLAGEGNGIPLQYSGLENPMDGGAWWAAVYGVTQSRTWLTRLSSSSSNLTGRASHLGSMSWNSGNGRPPHSRFLGPKKVIAIKPESRTSQSEACRSLRAPEWALGASECPESGVLAFCGRVTKCPPWSPFHLQQSEHWCFSHV